jgi:succinoglycan biosynthesis protein ExoM
MQAVDKGMESSDILIGVVTFRRPIMLGSLLESLATQSLPADNLSVELCVVDNDAEGSATGVTREKAPRLPFRATYLCESRRGIPYARNRVLEEAIERGARWIAFIDDDETAAPDWLTSLYAVARETGADAVQGPVRYVAESGTPRWLTADLDVRSRRMTRRPEASAKPKLSTRNLLMSTRLASELGLRFDESFALSGGSDIDFFYRAHLLGAKNVWTNRALVTETIPAARLALGFQLQRAFRSAAGTTHSRRQIHGLAPTLARTVPKVVGALIAGVALVPLAAVSRRQGLKCLRHFAAAVGHVAGLAGRTGQQYSRIQGY